jgi:hypothetical protein
MSMFESFDACQERKGAVFFSKLNGTKAHRQAARGENQDETNLMFKLPGAVQARTNGVHTSIELGCRFDHA